MTNTAVIVSGGNREGVADYLFENRVDTILIGVDAGALHLLDLGYTPDLAIGDFDSIAVQELERLESQVALVVKLPSKKDCTDTEAALDYVKENLNVEEIVMFGLFGGRVDHMISNLWLAYQPGYQQIIRKIVMKSKNNTVRFYRPGHYSLDQEKDKKYLSFIGMTPLKKLTLENVKYPLSAADYSEPVALVSNEFLADQMTFSFAKGLLAVIQSKD